MFLFELRECILVFMFEIREQQQALLSRISNWLTESSEIFHFFFRLSEPLDSVAN